MDLYAVGWRVAESAQDYQSSCYEGAADPTAGEGYVRRRMRARRRQRLRRPLADVAAASDLFMARDIGRNPPWVNSPTGNVPEVRFAMLSLILLPRRWHSY